MPAISETPSKQAPSQGGRPAGRPPERSAEVSGDEAKGMTPVSPQRTVQPEPAGSPVSAQIVSQPILPAAVAKPLPASLTSPKPL